ncbi:MAG: Vitamin B12 import ATP-binding protein BtuD [Phycisphaerae bacterium]|nr:Vitamin B12 import ATP-binding protein BtuD [Phycisphaerae bacterium]
MIDVTVQFTRGDFSLDVRFHAGARVLGLFGPSGAGKTTLMHLLAGLFPPDSGTIRLNGDVLFDAARRIHVPAHRRRVGVVFQEHRLFPHLSVEGNLCYARGRAAAREDGDFKTIVDLLELGAFLDRRVTALSGGERQRVALGRVLLSRPRLMLFDEPLASLDQRLKAQILPYLQRVRDASDIPMLYVSHDLSEILQLTDQLLAMDRGALVGQGRYADLVHDARVMSVVHDRGFTNVLTAWVARHEPTDGVSVVRLRQAEDEERLLVIPRCGAAAGERVSLSIQPWEVALAGDTVHPVSIQNQISGTVTRCTLHERRAIVEVDIGALLIVEVSRRSAASMRLAPGSAVVCLIKSHAVRLLGAS